jgi:hypothetical protein
MIGDNYRKIFSLYVSKGSLDNLKKLSDGHVWFGNTHHSTISEVSLSM